MMDVVVQGPTYRWTREFINRYRQYNFVDKIIFSTWEDNTVLYGDWDIDEFVVSKYPENPGLGNRNLQIVSSLAGMNATVSDVVMKIRSDMFVPLDEVWRFYCTQRVNDNILTLSVYPRFPFHPRDHMFIGQTKNMWELFDIPLDTISAVQYNETQHVRSETYIGSHYCKRFNSQIEVFINEPYKYLTDNASHKNLAIEVSNNLILARRGFQPLNQLQIDWPKYYPNGYPFEHLKQLYGEVYHEDLQNGLRV